LTEDFIVNQTIKTNVLVIGAGPAGYVAAIRAGQLGLETVIVEAERPGGACLNRGCIPSKALIHAAGEFAAMTARVGEGQMGLSLASPPMLDLAGTMAWKDGIVRKLNTGVATLLKKAHVTQVQGHAMFSDAKTCTVETKTGPVTITAQSVVLATGARPVELPFLPFGGDVISSTEALALDRLPQTLAVVGAGYIGLELGIAFAKLGTRVTVVEAQDRILSLYDSELTAPVGRWLSRHGVDLHLSARARGLGADGGLEITTSAGETLTVPAEKILVTVGRRPVTDGFGLEQMGVDMDGPFIAIDDRMRTSMRGVYAIGDVTGEPMLAHRASAQGERVAEIIAGHDRRFEPVAIPAVCFTEPEIVSVGLSPSEAEARGYETVIGQFPYQANGRALSMEAGDGFVRVVAAREDHRLLGVQAVGAHVSELSAAFVTALEMGAVLEDIAGIIHAHPTLSEAFHEASLKALGQAIHI
jgi:dihydrolipoamide dehydrogenase